MTGVKRIKSILGV